MSSSSKSAITGTVGDTLDSNSMDSSGG